MNPITTQHDALDNALVPSEKRLKIKKCNARIALTKPQKEEKYQFWNTIKKIGKSNAYDFKLDKKKCLVDTEKKIYSHLSRNLVILESVTCYLPFELIKCTSLGGNLLLSLTGASLGNQQDLISLGNYKVPPEKAREFKKPASPKLRTVPASPKEPTLKGKRVKRAAKKATTIPTTDVIIRDTPDKSASGSSEGANFELEVPDEQTDKPKDTNEGIGKKPGVLNVSKDDSTDSKFESWCDSQNESDDVKTKMMIIMTMEMMMTVMTMMMVEIMMVVMRMIMKKILRLLWKTMEKKNKIRSTCILSKSANLIMKKRCLKKKTTMLERSWFVQGEDDGLVTLTTIHGKTEGTTQSSSISSDYTSIVDNYLASKLKEEVNVTIRLQSNKLKEEAEVDNQEFINQVDSTMKKIINDQVKAQVSKIMPQIEDYVTKSLGAKVLVRSTNQPQTSYAVIASLSEFKLKTIIIDKMETNELINRSDIQMNLYNALVESYNTDKDILSTYSDVVTLKIGRDDQDKDEDPFAGSDRWTKIRKSIEDAKPSKGTKTKESKSSSSSKGNKSSHIDDQPDNEAAPKHDWFQKPNKPPTPCRAWNISKSINFRLPQKWICTIAKECYKEKQPPRTFNELMGTPIDFSAYVMNRLKIDNLTQEILVGPDFNLLKGTCKRFVKLEYHFKECYKAVNDLLDWYNPEGNEYPFNLSKPLPLIKDQGLKVDTTNMLCGEHITGVQNDKDSMHMHATGNLLTMSTPKEELLRVDTLTPKLLAGPTYELMKGSCKSLVELEYQLEEVYKATTDQLDCVNPEGQQYPHNFEYLRGGASSRKYTTSITKTKAVNYRHIKWIEDLVPMTMWIQIVEWHNYKHLDWITVRRDDDKLYKFKEGDFKRLRIQEIEDMLLLLVQGKLTNLTIEERFAFNVSLRMFTRSIVIQRRVEDLQLGVKSCQKKLNLTKLDTYRSDLKRKEAYITYSNPRGFIYQNKDKKNRDSMQYLPQSIWRKSDKDRAAVMIQAIDRRLKNRRIMRSLERFVGGRPKENTKCVSATGEELTAAKHKLELKLFRDAAAAVAHMK
nr:hypothetical protein [Tanacetum cinerariifolium]